MTSVGKSISQITILFNRLLGSMVGFDYAQVSDSCSQACRKNVGDRHTDRQTDTQTDTQTPPILL